MRGALTGRSHTYKFQSLPVIHKQYYLGVGNLKQVVCSCGILNNKASRCGRISRVQGPFQHWSTQTCNRLEAEKDLRSNMQTQWESYIPTRFEHNSTIIAFSMQSFSAVERAHWDNMGLKTFSIQHGMPCSVSSFYWCPSEEAWKRQVPVGIKWTVLSGSTKHWWLLKFSSDRQGLLQNS